MVRWGFSFSGFFSLAPSACYVVIMAEEKPDDYIFNAVPRSKRESVARDAETRVTETTKNAIVSYLSLFLAPDGIHRRLLNLTARFSVQFETRIQGARDKDDPSVYEIQLARYWGELRQKLPCIIIVDSGFEFENPGLGGITDSFPINLNTSSVQLTMLAKVPIEIQVAAMDETTCADIRDLLVYILGPLSHINKGHVIRSKRPEDRWEVRLPLDFTPSGLERRNINEDTVDSLWTTSISIVPSFEGLIQVGFDNQVHPDMIKLQSSFDGLSPMGFRQSDGCLIPVSSAPSISGISVPSTVKLSQHGLIQADWIPARSCFISDNPRVAIIDQEACSIIPRRIGTFNLKLVQYTPGAIKTADSGPRILHTWPVTVTHS